MAKKTAVNFENYDFTVNPDNYTTEEIITIKRMVSAGEPIYLAPVEIEFQGQFDNLHISYAQCRSWFIGSQKVTVHLTPSDGATYDFLLGELRAKHRDGVRKSRCMVIGKRGRPIRCDERNKCSECPFGRRPEDREAQEISWDEMVGGGYEIAGSDTTADAVFTKMEIEEAEARLDSKDPRIMKAIRMRDAGYDVKDIMDKLGLSQRRVYQLLKAAKA